MTELQAAIALIKRLTPVNNPWTLDDLADIDPDRPADVDHAIVTLLNAAAYGDIIPTPTGCNAAAAAMLHSARTMAGPA